jgi:hypothetical protein
MIKRDEHYKGYILQTSPFHGDISIRKDGKHIAWAPSEKDAKLIIDLLTFDIVPKAKAGV